MCVQATENKRLNRRCVHRLVSWARLAPVREQAVWRSRAPRIRGVRAVRSVGLGGVAQMQEPAEVRPHAVQGAPAVSVQEGNSAHHERGEAKPLRNG